jgi:DUF971 family protein
MTSSASAPWPTELRLSADKANLRITFNDGGVFDLSAELLRVLSPSAEVQGHSPSERKIVAGKRNVKIARLEAVGHYAIRIIFDDGHSTGIYSWPYLHEIALEKETRWQSYLDGLAAGNLSR